MRLQMRGVDHDPLRLAALAGQFGENLVEHAQAAPAHEPIVDCLVRAIVGRSIAPAQPVLDHKHDRADDPPVLQPERSRATAENPPRSDASEPETTKTNLPWRSLLASPRNQPIRRSARTLMGPEPRRGASRETIGKKRGRSLQTSRPAFWRRHPLHRPSGGPLPHFMGEGEAGSG